MSYSFIAGEEISLEPEVAPANMPRQEKKGFERQQLHRYQQFWALTA